MDTYIATLRKYAVFSGRATRKELWIFFLPNIAAYLIWIVAFTADNPAFYDSASGNISRVISVLFILYVLAFLFPSVAVLTRRLHDNNLSAWWLLIGLVPLAGPIVLIVFAVLDGQPGNNRYGANPEGSGHTIASEPAVPVLKPRVPLALRIMIIVLAVISFLGASSYLLFSFFAVMFCDSGPVSTCIHMADIGLLLWLSSTTLTILSLVFMTKKPKLALCLSLLPLFILLAGLL